jgi:hypothetical protein
MGRGARQQMIARFPDGVEIPMQGYEDAAAAFLQATTVSVEKTSSASDEFATALRDFCQGVSRTVNPAELRFSVPGLG